MRRAREITYGLFGPLTPTVKVLLWINVITYLLLSITGPEMRALMVNILGLTPAHLIHNFALWQLCSYMFLHIGFLHLLFNMLCLWWFGASIEMVWGGRNFLRFYLFTGIGAGICHAALLWNSTTPMIGASGAIFGILLAYGLLFPERQILFMFILPMKAKYFVAIIGAMEFFAILGGGGIENDPVARLAHLGGLLFAGLWFFYYRVGFRFLSPASLQRKWRRRQARKRLKVIPIQRPTEEAEEEVEEKKPPTVH